MQSAISIEFRAHTHTKINNALASHLRASANRLHNISEPPFIDWPLPVGAEGSLIYCDC